MNYIMTTEKVYIILIGPITIQNQRTYSQNFIIKTKLTLQLASVGHRSLRPVHHEHLDTANVLWLIIIEGYQGYS